MAIEYRLALAGNISVERVAERAFPDPVERPAGTASRLVSHDEFDERYGFDVIIRPGRNGYFDVISDTGPWLWEPSAYVGVTFRMDKSGDRAGAVLSMLAVVRRVLDSGPEDAVLVFDSDVLLLTRFDEGVVKRRRAWWDSYAGAEDRLPDGRAHGRDNKDVRIVHVE